VSQIDYDNGQHLDIPDPTRASHCFIMLDKVRLFMWRNKKECFLLWMMALGIEGSLGSGWVKDIWFTEKSEILKGFKGQAVGYSLVSEAFADESKPRQIDPRWHLFKAKDRPGVILVVHDSVPTDTAEIRSESLEELEEQIAERKK